LLALLKLHIRGLNGKPATVNRKALNIFIPFFTSFSYPYYKSEGVLQSAKYYIYYIIESFLI
jgi:hypothetical protein